MNATSRRTYTTTDAAQRFSRDPSRIRQICIAHNIGTLVKNRVRLLSETDLKKIGKILEKYAR